MTEAGGVANGTPGIPTAAGDLNSTEVDKPGDAWMAVATATASTSCYGTLYDRCSVGSVDLHAGT